MSDLVVFNLDEERLDLLKRTICKGATTEELELFAAVCNRTGLDPFARQIYAVRRWDSRLGREVLQTQVSIDGFRLVAQRSGEYAGQTPVQWCGEDGQWRDIWLASVPPTAARVGVYRRGFAEPCYAIALWSEYAQYKNNGSLSGLWARMPSLMLAKCAEALALRKAFPAELSGLYSEEELSQADSEDAPPARRALPAPARAALPAPVTREERRADTERLLSPVPAAERPVEAPAAPTAQAGATGGQTGTLTLVARAWTVAPIKRPNGSTVYRVDVEGSDEPYAVVDAALIHSLESESAFGHTVEVAWATNPQGRRVITGVLDA